MNSLRMLLSLGFCLIKVLACAQEAAKPVADFTTPPTVTQEKDGTKISFAVAAPTDVEVGILDGQGHLVRHLAAGVLGKNAPEPFKADSLAQVLLWDGKDDFGKTLQGGAFSVRVRIGMRPKLEKFIGGNVSALGMVRGLACASNGELFILHDHGTLHPGDATAQCSVFTREGVYLRTILPFPANLPPEKLKSLKRIDLGDGTSVPFIYHGECRELIPGAGMLPPLGCVVSKGGRFAFPGLFDRQLRYQQSGPVQVLMLGTDGSVSPDGLIGCELSPNTMKGAFLALSPDDKTMYATGLSDNKKPNPQSHVVLKYGWSDRQPQVFAGKPGVAGASETLLNDPTDVSTDKAGNVYIADRLNDRVAVIDPNGKFQGALKTERPERVKVHPVSGAIYVLGGSGCNVLQKFASVKDASPMAELKLPTFKIEGFTAVMALDASAEPPVLWFSPSNEHANYKLLRIEDKGSAFSAPVDIGKQLCSKGIGNVSSVEFNRVAGNLVVNSRLFDPAKDVFGPAPNILLGTSIYPLSAGLDGNFYTQVYGNFLLRYGPDLKPLPFKSSTNKNGGVQDQGTSARVRGRGVTADPAGHIYMIWQEDYSPKPSLNHVHIHGQDGAVIKENYLVSDIRSLNSIRVDYKGNTYLALGLRPGHDRIPQSLKGKVPEDEKSADAVDHLNCYPMIYGSIAKFGPEGGTIQKGAGGVTCNYAFNNQTDVKGALWIYSGASPVPSWRTAGTPDICLCESPRFDVDGYGRSFFTDAARFRVGVLDTNGNELMFFGSYGNPDSQGEKSAIPAPEFPFWWIDSVSCGDDVLFVGDRLNRRVMQVKLTYTSEKTVPIGK